VKKNKNVKSVIPQFKEETAYNRRIKEFYNYDIINNSEKKKNTTKNTIDVANETQAPISSSIGYIKKELKK
jgi:hypothetical protein